MALMTLTRIHYYCQFSISTYDSDLFFFAIALIFVCIIIFIFNCDTLYHCLCTKKKLVRLLNKTFSCFHHRWMRVRSQENDGHNSSMIWRGIKMKLIFFKFHFSPLNKYNCCCCCCYDYTYLTFVQTTNKIIRHKTKTKSLSYSQQCTTKCTLHRDRLSNFIALGQAGGQTYVRAIAHVSKWWEHKIIISRIEVRIWYSSFTYLTLFELQHIHDLL